MKPKYSAQSRARRSQADVFFTGRRRPVLGALAGSLGLALLVLLIGAGCEDKDKADATTGASPKSNWLPEKGESYEVLGHLPGLKNFVVRYDNGLLRGGDLESEQALDSLEKLEVRTIVSVTPTDLERDLAQRGRIELLELPFEKKPIPQPTLSGMYTALAAGDKPLYVHCHGGTHRGGIVGLFQRIHLDGWDSDKALAEYVALGGDPETDAEMIRSVLEYSPPN